MGQQASTKEKIYENCFFVLHELKSVNIKVDYMKLSRHALSVAIHVATKSLGFAELQ